MLALLSSAPLPTFYGFDAEVFEVLLHEPSLAERVPEALIQDLWLTQAFDTASLQTVTGESVQVLDPGHLNTDSGPDFKGARLQKGDLEWVGDIEIHNTSHGWNTHRHNDDPAYNAVILHVVLQADMWTGQLMREDGTLLPELVLAPHLQTPLRKLLYHFLTHPRTDLPCASHWSLVPQSKQRAWLASLARDRMLAKRDALATAYLRTPNLAPLLYERLFAGLGYSKNVAPMQHLTERLPLHYLQQFDDPVALEALLLGTAGLLPDDDASVSGTAADRTYITKLRTRYTQLEKNSLLPPLSRTQWQFFRLRPSNFPPLRLAQGAMWLRSDGLLRNHPLEQLAAKMLGSDPLPQLYQLLRVAPGPFWETHVRLEKPLARKQSGMIGRQRAQDLIVNAILPVVLLHAQQHDHRTLEEACFALLERLPPTSDEITRLFEPFAATPRHALASQGYHQLYRSRCVSSHCLTCPIGTAMLNSV